ncbi:MAG: DNA repair protein RecO [Methylococcaceae bacterium]|nr:MAG: DNA repair protein RecO [Methylococcaceae bacterium]
MQASHPHRIQLQPGYVLHRRPYRETSLLVDVFSREYGKVGLLAKGVRGGKTARVDSLPPFRPLLLSWTGKGELPLLTGVESAAPSPPLQGVALYCGFYLNELLQAFLHRHDPQPLLFERYAGLLADLPVTGDKDRLLRAFELTLLQELGYGLQLHCDAEHHRDIQPGQSYHYVPDRGPIAARADAGSIRGITLIALREGRLDDAATRREAKWLLRRVIHHHLAGRPLKSRELFRQKSHESS